MLRQNSIQRQHFQYIKKILLFLSSMVSVFKKNIDFNLIGLKNIKTVVYSGLLANNVDLVELPQNVACN